MTALQCMRKFGALTCILVLAACSNGRGSLEEEEPEAPPANPPSQFTVRVTISGLAGSGLVLQNNGGDDIAVVANGTVAFADSLADGAAYAVTVLSQPSNPGQTCTVANGSGSIAGANVTNVAVTCATGTFAVGGTVTGLRGTGLVLQNNRGDDLAIPTDGEFSFATPIASGAAYEVSVLTPPSAPAQTCTIANGRGTMGGADVTNVQVICATGAFTIGVTVSGLLGSGLVLQNNGGGDLAITGNGTFVFPSAIASGASYSVTVSSHPSGPVQTCSVANPSGTVGNANVTNVAVSCATNVFTVGGTVAGLEGSGLVLQMNAGNDLLITRNGEYAFGTAVASGTSYVVSVKTDPSNPAQTCTVAPQTASGTVGSSNVTNVAVSCVTRIFSIGGNVERLEGSGLVLQKNGGDDLPIASTGRFTFATPQASGTTYLVTVLTPPVSPSQSCTVQRDTGTVGSADVTNVNVRCSTNSFLVGGTVSGLLGSGLELEINGGNAIEVESSGSFTFARRIASGAVYEVRVSEQPSNPTQSCMVAAGTGTGTVGSADVTSVRVECSTSSFAIGGTITGLSGSGLQLQNNGGETLTIAAGADDFVFPTPLASGARYDVRVVTQPTGPAQNCTLSNASGTVGGSAITNIRVTCVDTEFRVRGTVSGLIGSGLQLQNNGGDTLAIASNGSFFFQGSLPVGSPYSVTVLTDPANPSQTCEVSGGSGTIGNADITNVAVSCTTDQFDVGGTVTGLAGTGLVLQNNGGSNLPIDSDGSFSFRVASGGPYSISVATPPTGPTQTCSVTNGSGTVGNANVTNVAVQCTTSSFTIGGSVSGLAGFGLELQNNGTDNLPVTSSGGFTFSTPVLSGSPYSVSVAVQPLLPDQVCSVANGSGVVGGANVSNVSVTCEALDDDDDDDDGDD